MLCRAKLADEEAKAKAGDEKVTDEGGQNEPGSGEESDANTSFGSTRSALEDRVVSRGPGSVYERLVGNKIISVHMQVKVGRFLLCTLGKTGHMILEVTEIDWDDNTVTGIYYELQKRVGGEDTMKFRKRDDRHPTLLSFADLEKWLEPPFEESSGRHRKKYVFKTLQ